LAIQGKLVEQRPEEGTAEELKEKALHFNNKIRAEITDEEKTLDLPESWVWAKLSELTNDTTLNDGNWVLSKDMVSSGPVKLIQLGSIGNCKYIDKGFKYLTEEHFQELHGKQIHEGYLLVNRLIGDRMLCCILPPIDGILMTAVDVCWIAPNEELLNQKYLMYVLSSGDFQSKVKELGRGTTRFRISKLNLVNITFPLPPLAEQKRIVAKIEELLPLIDRYEKAWNRLEEFNKQFPGDLQKSILQMAIQGKLVEQIESDGNVDEQLLSIEKKRNELLQRGQLKKLGKINKLADVEIEIPSTWRLVRLYELICKRVDNRGKTPVHVSVKSEHDYIDLLEINAIVPGASIDHQKVEKFIDEETYSSLRGYVEEGDILIATVGSVGKFAIMDSSKSAIAQNIIGIRCFDDVDQKYIFYLLQSPYFYESMGSIKMEAVQASIKVPDLMNLFVPLPPLAEQKRIVAKLENLLPLVRKLNIA